MKLSQVLRSPSILPNNDDDGNGSWGIFLSSADSAFAVKLFCDEQQFADEKAGYDKVLSDPNLMRLVNPYQEVTLLLDTDKYPLNRIGQHPPFELALLMPFLANPPWEKIGKLGMRTTDTALAKLGVEVDNLISDFLRIGIASWELTFFIHSESSDIKAIDFTFSELVFKHAEAGCR
jgi:hypothetical protein